MIIAIISGLCVCGCAVGAIGYAAVSWANHMFDDMLDDFLPDEDEDKKNKKG